MFQVTQCAFPSPWPDALLWVLVSKAPRKALVHLVFTEPDQGQSPAPGAEDDTSSSWSCCFQREETDDKY